MSLLGNSVNKTRGCNDSRLGTLKHIHNCRLLSCLLAFEQRRTDGSRPKEGRGLYETHHGVADGGGPDDDNASCSGWTGFGPI